MNFVMGFDFLEVNLEFRISGELRSYYLEAESIAVQVGSLRG